MTEIDDTLYLYIEEPDGSTRRVGPDERGLALTEYSFGTSLPGGFSTADATAVLPEHPIDLPAKFAPVSLRSMDGTIAWEGRIESTPERSDDGTLTLSCVGHQAVLDDHPGVLFLGVLNDLAEWGEPPGEYIEAESDAGRVVNRRLSAQSGEGGVVITMDTDANVATKHRGVAWLSLPAGLLAARIEYVATQLAAGDMSTRFTFAQNEDGSDNEPLTTTNDLTVRSVTPSEPARYVRAVATPSSQVNKAEEFVWRVHRISVFGDHGLDRHTFDDNLPAGLLWSDVIGYLVATYAPTLDYEADPSDEPSPNIAALEPTTVGNMLEEAVSFEADREWAVYEGRTLHYKKRSSFGRVWVARRAEGAVFDGVGPTSEPDHDSVIVSFRDSDGTRRRVGPPGSGADEEDEGLQDTSPSNPVIASSAVATRPKLVEVSEPISTNKAIRIGKIALEEILRPRFSGTIAFPRYVECEGELLPSYLIRAGDRVIDGDRPGGEEMLIVETTYSSDDAQPLKATIDTPANRLDAALAGLSVRPGKLGGKRIRERLRRERKRRRHRRDLRKTVTGPGASGTGRA